MRIAIVRAAMTASGYFVHPYLHPTETADGSRELWTFVGKPKMQDWPDEPPVLKAEPPARILGDLSHFNCSGVLALSARARKLLGSVLDRCGEILPAQAMDGTPLFLFQPVPDVDCIDEERSVGDRIRRTGALSSITKYEFVPELVPAVPIFRARSNIFTVEGRDRKEPGLQSLAKQLGLTGFSFEFVWSDEESSCEP